MSAHAASTNPMFYKEKTLVIDRTRRAVMTPPL
jgi:hypothetical protein